MRSYKSKYSFKHWYSMLSIQSSCVNALQLSYIYSFLCKTLHSHSVKVRNMLYWHHWVLSSVATRCRCLPPPPPSQVRGIPWSVFPQSCISMHINALVEDYVWPCRIDGLWRIMLMKLRRNFYHRRCQVIGEKYLLNSSCFCKQHVLNHFCSH